MTPNIKQYDLVIVGGGMVGSALACALGDSPLKIAIIEGHELPLDWPARGFDLRVSAITHASQRLFKHLGVWEAITAERVSPYREMTVWDAGGSGHIHFDSADIGEPDLGHIIENRVITKALWQRAGEFDNIHRHCPATPQRLDLRPGETQLRLADGTSFQTGLLIGADGGNSWVRRQAEIGVNIQHYNQVALVTTVKTEHSHRETAWQRFLPTGPLAFLPLTEGYCSIVWSTTPEEAGRLTELAEADFKQQLETAFDARLGRILELGPRASFPIKGQHAQVYVKPHLALIGDAAHTIHPLAGQGVNLGFADASALAQVLLEAHAANSPIGSFKTLRRYERARKGDNLLMLEAMGAFKRLFSNDIPGLREARNLGLHIANRCPPLKHFFMRQVSGGLPQSPR